MFILITGKPRSGKSAYAVNHMLEKKKDYYNIYANINGLKMQDNIKPLNFNKLLEILTKCKYIYDTQIDNLGENSVNIIDEPIIDYLLEIGFIKENPKYQKYITSLEKRKKTKGFKSSFLSYVKPLKKEVKYKPTLIIIDEAQNHLPSKDKDTGRPAGVDPVISWWISYHGHLYTDVFLLSQNYHKIHSTYIYDIEYFLDAVPSSKMLLGNSSPNFIYKHHIATPFSSTNLAGKLKIKKIKEIFNAYESGDQVRTKSVVLPYIIGSFVLLIIVIIAFKMIASNMAGDVEEVKVIESVEQLKVIKNQKKEELLITDKVVDYKDLKYIKLDCISNTCMNTSNNINLNIDDLNLTITNTNSKFLSIKFHGNLLATVTILADREFLNLFKGAKRENNINSSLGFFN